MVGRKEVIKEQAQLKEGAAVRFGIWDQQNGAAALHPLGGASVFRGIAHTSQLCKTQHSLFSWEHCYASSQCEGAAVENFT